MKDHAFLSPSASHRWLVCTRSPHFEAKFPDSISEYADEGSLAHDLAAHKLNYRLGRLTKSRYESLRNNAISLYSKKGIVHSKEMDVIVDGYVNYALNIFSELSKKSKAFIFVEEWVDLSEVAPESFGTVDIFILHNSGITVIDFKYGVGIHVSAIANTQLGLYALGILSTYGDYWDFKKVELHIYQPRIDNISVFKSTIDELGKWGINAKKKAQLAFDNEGDFIPGGHCRFCKGKTHCKRLAETNLELAKYEFNIPDQLTDLEISDILRQAKLFINWINSISDYALQEARKGKHWPGFKLVEGRSNRKITDVSKAEKALMRAGYWRAVITSTELLPITKLEAIVGKAKLEKILADLIIKPPGSPTLVPTSDKRIESNSTEHAKNDFKNIKIKNHGKREQR